MKKRGKKDYRLCIFMHSGAYDRVHEGFSIANVCLATGGEVHMLFTYGALRRLCRGKTDRFILEKEPAPSIKEFKKHLRRGAVEAISGMLKMGKKFGRLKIYACTGAMSVMNISRGELIKEVDSTVGLVGFMGLVKEADLTLYI